MDEAMEALKVVMLTLLAGLMIPLGGVIAQFENVRPHWLEQEFRHFVIAFGGGALLAAVALVLVPQGSKELSIPATVAWFSLGSVALMALDIVLTRNGSPASQLAATLSDYLPEALALGAVMASGASGSNGALLLALLIALQNLPEGFNSFREINDTGMSTGKLLTAFFFLPLLGPVAGLLGYFVFADYPSVTAAVMLFAAGGILYLVFQDIAPQAKLERHWSPPLGAVAGFLLGLVGHLLLH